jgi:hypothetical protein
MGYQLNQTDDPKHRRLRALRHARPPGRAGGPDPGIRRGSRRGQDRGAVEGLGGWRLRPPSDAPRG